MTKDPKSRALLSALQKYIESCKIDNETKDKREKRTIPNVCGLCRHMKIGKNELLRRVANDPKLADRISTVLEDSVINSDPTAGTLSHCIKLIDSLRDGEDDISHPLTVIFEHPDGEETDNSTEDDT